MTRRINLQLDDENIRHDLLAIERKLSELDQIATFAPPRAVGTVNAEGTAETLARSDHVHAGWSPIKTLANSATPSVKGVRVVKSGGTTTITNLLSGVAGQEIVLIAQHAITISNGMSLVLNNAAGNFVMAAGDTIHLVQSSDNVWYEVSRSDNTP